MRGGTTKTFFDPATPPEEAVTEADVEVIFGGRHVRLTYASAVMGSPHVGEMTFSHDCGRFAVSWLDSFHTGSVVMALAGDKGGEMDALGSYAAGHERSGWRASLCRCLRALSCSSTRRTSHPPVRCTPPSKCGCTGSPDVDEPQLLDDLLAITQRQLLEAVAVETTDITDAPAKALKEVQELLGGLGFSGLRRADGS